MPVLPGPAKITLIVPTSGLRQYLFGVPDGFGVDDHWNDTEGALTFLLGLADPGSSCSSPWYIRGPGDIGNKSSDCASWIPPPSYSAT